MFSSSNRALRRIAALALVLCAAVPALADDAGPYYDVPVQELQSPYIQWIFLALFTVLTMLVAFKNPHRTHMD